MATFRYRPSKFGAALSVPVGIAMIVFAIVEMSHSKAPVWALVIWCLFVVGIVAFNVWAAFAPNGHIGTITTDE